MARNEKTRPYRQVTERACCESNSKFTTIAAGLFLALTLSGVIPGILIGMVEAVM